MPVGHISMHQRTQPMGPPAAGALDLGLRVMREHSGTDLTLPISQVGVASYFASLSPRRLPPLALVHEGTEGEADEGEEEDGGGSDG